MQSPSYEFDVGLSFAGEQRHYVERVAEELTYRGILVFYDAYDQANLWGKDLSSYFKEVFQEKCRYCVVFASREYAAKVWPSVERENALKRAFQSSEEYILPVRFDETIIPGLPDSIGYLDADKVSPEKVSELVAEKLGLATPASRIEFAFLCSSIKLTPRLTVELPGFNKQHPSQGPLLSLIKVVFAKGATPVAPIEVRATDAEGQEVGRFNGFISSKGIAPAPEGGELSPMTSETPFVHGVLITDEFNLQKPGEYRFAWYLDGILQRTSTMHVYLPDESVCP